MSTDTYVGGDPFIPTYWYADDNWSDGAPPAEGDVADIFGTSSVTTVDPETNVDGGPILGLTIDLSGTYPGFQLGEPEQYQVVSLAAGQLGSAAAPVTVLATADSGSASNSAISFGSLTGSINVQAGSNLTLGQSGPIYGNVDVEGGLSSIPYFLDGERLEVAPVTINGVLSIDGGTTSFAPSVIDGSGAIIVSNGGTFGFTSTLEFLARDDLPIYFEGSGQIDAANYAYVEAPIYGFGKGDVIDESFIDANDEYPISETFSNNTLTVYDGPQPALSLNIVGDYTARNFVVTLSNQTFQISYAPTSAFSTIAGVSVNQPDVDYLAIKPFSQVSISNPNGGTPTDTVTITPSSQANGALFDPGQASDGGHFVDGSYVITASASAVSAAIQGLVFTPTEHQVPAGQTVTTSFTISDLNSDGATTTATASVVVTALNYINGPSSGGGLLNGTSGQDVIHAYGTSNIINANGGDDFINAGAGSATVNLSTGNTTTELGGEGNVIRGSNGSNTITGASGGLSSIVLGNGNNVVDVGGELNYIELGGGNNTINGTVGLSFITTGGGNDTITVQGIGNTVNAGNGTNVIHGGAALDTFILPSAFRGFDTITGFQQYNDDLLNIQSALSSTAWNGKASTLGNFLKVTDSSNATNIGVVTSSGTSQLATLQGVSLTFNDLNSRHSFIT